MSPKNQQDGGAPERVWDIAARETMVKWALWEAGFCGEQSAERGPVMLKVFELIEAARADAYLEEVTYWLGEHRAYLESGMMWESELAMKNSRRYGELAKAARERGGKVEEPLERGCE